MSNVINELITENPYMDHEPKSTIQSWVNALPLMQQAVLLSAIRGPDGVKKFHPCKDVIRWYRRCVLITAFEGKAITNPYHPGGGSFTGPSCFIHEKTETLCTWQLAMRRPVDEFMQSSDDLPHHYFLHAIHAFEILGYKHPDREIREWWCTLYIRLVHSFHMYPESEDLMDLRLGDNFTDWGNRSDPACCCSD